MNFYQALQKLLESNVKIRRDNWSDTTWIEGPASLRDIVTENHIFADRFPVGTSIDYPPTINVVDSIDEDPVERAYVPTQQDMLATNWEVIEHPESVAGLYVSTHEIVKSEDKGMWLNTSVRKYPYDLKLDSQKIIETFSEDYISGDRFDVYVPKQLWSQFKEDNRLAMSEESLTLLIESLGIHVTFSTQPIS